MYLFPLERLFVYYLNRLRCVLLTTREVTVLSSTCHLHVCHCYWPMVNYFSKMTQFSIYRFLESVNPRWLMLICTLAATRLELKCFASRNDVAKATWRSLSHFALELAFKVLTQTQKKKIVWHLVLLSLAWRENCSREIDEPIMLLKS